MKNVLTFRKIEVLKKLGLSQDNKWGKLEFQMKMVEECFNLLKGEGFEKFGTFKLAEISSEKRSIFWSRYISGCWGKFAASWKYTIVI